MQSCVCEQSFGHINNLGIVRMCFVLADTCPLPFCWEGICSVFCSWSLFVCPGFDRLLLGLYFGFALWLCWGLVLERPFSKSIPFLGVVLRFCEGLETGFCPWFEVCILLEPGLYPKLDPGWCPGLDPGLFPGLCPGLEPGLCPGLETGLCPGLDFDVIECGFSCRAQAFNAWLMDCK